VALLSEQAVAAATNVVAPKPGSAM